MVKNLQMNSEVTIAMQKNFADRLAEKRGQEKTSVR